MCSTVVQYESFYGFSRWMDSHRSRASVNWISISKGLQALIILCPFLAQVPSGEGRNFPRTNILHHSILCRLPTVRCVETEVQLGAPQIDYKVREYSAVRVVTPLRSTVERVSSIEPNETAHFLSVLLYGACVRVGSTKDWSLRSTVLVRKGCG